ncbi:hypothetical protein AXG93_2909s1040 [Marchantia polymorpha subsp. ruderalis]|uniref:Uncharacterized protein n=1 Tax=Marchantia polymorpha subsp. ruderalis TaxID=1480154 RepID=A0A176WDA1_MARPO|nr:hypothetical protein AXG93_2909s1040 [Marchantia polymorpha subsp. ruderalis]
MSEARDHRQVSTKLKTPNARAKTKVKARQLILEADSSTESSVAASQDHLTLAKWAKLEAEIVVREKDVPSEKNLRTSEVRHSAVVKRRATRKEKVKAIMTEEGILGRNQVPSAKVRMVTSPRTSTETVILETSKDFLVEEIKSEGVNAADVLCGQVIPLLRYLEAKYEVLWKRLEASRVAFNKESRRIDELTADLEKKDQAHAAEPATKVKALAECEAARILDLGLIERLEAKCNEMRSQRSLT